MALMWGAEDLVASMGGASSRTDEGRYRAVAMHARSAVLIAGGTTGKHVIDSVFVDIANLSGLAGDAADAVALGIRVKGMYPSKPSADRPRRLRTHHRGRCSCVRAPNGSSKRN